MTGARDRKSMLKAHVNFLQKKFNDRSLLYACFNYDFFASKYIDNSVAPSQVGPLGEFVRTEPQSWRSFDPVFSVAARQVPFELPTIEDCEFTAFGKKSIFYQLDQMDGSLCFYGAGFHSATIIHYIEILSGGPLYRYDKFFKGRMRDVSGVGVDIDYIYHVRPMDRYLDYDWPRLTEDLFRDGILHSVSCGEKVFAYFCSVKRLRDYWLEKLLENSFYLLDKKSLEWVLPLYGKLNRRFCLMDFEK